MAPTPSTSASAISIITARQESTDSPSATTLELLLITFALLISSVLIVIPKKRSVRKQPRNPAFSQTIIVIALLFTLGAFGLALATLVLGWLRVISLDAVASIVFALGPAFISIPLEILSYWQETVNSHLMWKNISLNIPTTQFRYIRFIAVKQLENEQQCVFSQLKDDLPSSDKGPKTRWPDQTFMIIRYMPQSSKLDSVSRCMDKLCIMDKAKDIEDPTATVPTSLLARTGERSQWNHIYGKHVATYDNFSVIQDTDHGITSWWWSGVSSARHLVARPAILHLESKRRVVNALALLSDIISIGDLVLHFHQDLFHWMLRNDRDVRTAVTSAPGFTCNRILRELDMEGWDSIGTEVLFSDFEPRSTKRYSIMFLILADKSQRFFFPETKRDSHSDKFYSGQEVLHELWTAGNDKNFFWTAKNCVDRWLTGWNLQISEVERLISSCLHNQTTANHPN